MTVAWRFRPRRKPRILVTSPFEVDWKGAATALRAITALRRSGKACDVIRISVWPLNDEERALVPPNEFHHQLTPTEVARVVRSCDLHIAPSWEQEGFGLPVLESMASGVPVVASNISCFRSFAAEAARLVPPEDADAFASAARGVLALPAEWRRMRRTGLRGARGFTESAAAETAEETLYWVASGEWRESADSSGFEP